MSTIGIIGAGQLTQQYYLPALEHSRIFSNILLADTEEKRIKECEVRFQCTGVSVNELQKTCSDIIIATPPSSHAELIHLCMGPSKQILCEKPVLLSTTELDTILTDSTAQGCCIYGAHIRRLFPALKAAKAYLQHTHTGELLKVDIYEGGRYNYSSRSEYHLSSVSGGVWADTGAHALDAAFYLCGVSDNGTDIRFNHMSRDKPEPAHDICANFTLQSIEFNVRLSRYQQLSNKINLYFEHCTVEVPLYLNPYFNVWKGGHKEVHACEFFPAYLPQAFRMELHEVFINKNQGLLGLDQFKLITRVLEAGLSQL